jgi:two-component system KDP operon response regulator KdpE
MTIGKILIVEDERTTRMALCEALSQSNYVAVPASNGNEAITLLKTNDFDVVVLDLQMPGRSGIAVLSEAEIIAPETPFIILTAHASTETAIQAIRLHAFDYLLKPASLQVIISTVHRALYARREKQKEQQALYAIEQALHMLQGEQTITPTTFSLTEDEVIEIAGIQLNTQQQNATYQNTPLTLTPIEYNILHHFITHPNTILTYADLAGASHNMELDEDNARLLLRTHLYRLRRKLTINENSPIQNIRGRGYILQI